MNKNRKFHGADFEANAHAISDDALEAVSGGSGCVGVCTQCGRTIENFSSSSQTGEKVVYCVCVDCANAQF